MKRVSLVLTLVVAFAPPASASEPIKPESFERIRGVIKPQAREDKWAGIAWQIDLWEARKVAAKEGKPILLWEMDGHPLGCG